MAYHPGTALLQRLASRRATKLYQDARKWDARPPILFLRSFNQDTLNLPYVQKGLHSLKEVIFANYGETKPRHFHQLYNKWLGIP